MTHLVRSHRGADYSTAPDAATAAAILDDQDCTECGIPIMPERRVTMSWVGTQDMPTMYHGAFHPKCATRTARRIEEALR